MASYSEQKSSEFFEKRKIPRFAVQLPAQLGPLEDISSICTNLSSEGVLVETSQTLNVGERVSLHLFISAKQRPLRMLGQIVWKQDTGATDPKETPVVELGIRFVRPLANAWKIPYNMDSNMDSSEENSEEMPF